MLPLFNDLFNPDPTFIYPVSYNSEKKTVFTICFMCLIGIVCMSAQQPSHKNSDESLLHVYPSITNIFRISSALEPWCDL